MMMMMMIVMSMSQVMKYSSSFLQSACAQLNPYDRRYHYGKKIPYDIRGKSILLLGHLGAWNIDAS